MGTMGPAIVFLSAVLGAIFLPLDLAAAATATCVFLPFIRLEFFGIGIRPEDAMIVPILVRIILQRRQGLLHGRVRRLGTIYGVLALLLLVSAIYPLMRYGFRGFFAYDLAVVVGSSLLLVAIVGAIQSRKSLRRLWTGIVIGGLVMCGAAAVSYQYSTHATGGGGGARFDRAMYEMKSSQAVLFESVNSGAVGLVAGSLFWLSLPVALQAQNRKTRVLAGALAMCFAVTLVRSYSRTAIISTVVALLLFVIRSNTKTMLKIVAVSTSCAALVVLAGGIRVQAFEFSLAENRNAGERPAIWQAGYEAATRNPLGYGLGGAELAIAEHMNGRQLGAHSLWLQLALEGGIIGLTVALCLFLGLWSLSQRTVRFNLVPAGYSIGGRQWILYVLAGSVASLYLHFMKLSFVILAFVIATSNVNELLLTSVRKCTGQARRRSEICDPARSL